MTTKERFNAAKAVAAYIRVDQAEMEDNYRYQPTRTPCRVYKDRDGTYFFTATRYDRKPKASDDHHLGRWIWRRMNAPGYVKAMGWRVWRALQEGEVILPGDVTPSGRR